MNDVASGVPGGVRFLSRGLGCLALLVMLGAVPLSSGCAAATWSQKASQALASVDADDSPAQRLEAGELALLVRGHVAQAQQWLGSVVEDGEATPQQRSRAGLALAYSASLTANTALQAAAILKGLPSADSQQAEWLVRMSSQVWGNLASSGLEDELREAVEAVAAKPGAQWQPARAAANAVKRSLSRLGTSPTAMAASFEATGVLRTWRLSAPWGQSPARDAQRTLGPEKRPLKETESVGAGWSKRPRKTWSLTFSDGEVGFPQMPPEGGVGFAETWLEVPSEATDRRVVVSLETNRDVSLWVNTTKVLHIDALARRQRSYQRLGLTLPQGRSRILVKLATTRPGGFAQVTVVPLVSVDGSGGDGVPGVFKTLADPAQLASEVLPTAPVPTFPPPPSVMDSASVRASALEAGNAAEAVRRLLTVDQLTSRPYRDTDNAYRVLASLKQALPTYPGMGLCEAKVIAADTDLGAAQARGQRRTALEAVNVAWPENVPALRQRAKLEIADGRLDEGLALLRKALAASPKDLPSRLAEMLLYKERGWEAEAVASAGALARDGADSPRVLQEIVDLYRHFGRSQQVGIALDALERSFPQQAVVRRARWLGDRGDLAARANLLATHWERHPERFSLVRRAVRALRAKGDLGTAAALVGKVLSVRPADPWGLSERVLLAIDAGDEAARRRAIDRALKIWPSLQQLGALKSWLLGTPPAQSEVADSRTLIDAYRRKLASEAKAGLEAGLARYPVVTLLDRTVIDVGDDGLSRELTHVVRVIQSKAGADKLGELRPPRDAELLVVRSIKADGRVLWPERVAGKPDLSFKGLAPGDAVEWAWIRSGDVRPEEGGYITGLSFAFWNVPTLRKEADVSVAPRFRLTQHVRNGAPAPTITAVKGASAQATRRRYSWAVDDLPALEREPLAANARLFFPYIDLTVWPAVEPDTPNKADAAWRAIARGYKAQLDRLTQPGPRAQKTALAAKKRAGRPGGSALWAAFDFVKEEINHTERFNSFESSAEQGLAGQKGNRNVVLVAVAKALGSRADIVLCAPRQHGLPVDAANPLPNANRFWYPVVRIAGKTPSDVTFADPSRPYNPFGVLPRAMYGARCLDLEAASRDGATVKTAFTSLPSYDLYEGTALGWTFDVTLDVDASGAAKGTLTGTGFGPVASGLRHVYLNADEKRREQIWQQWTASVIKGARVVEWDVQDEVDADQPITWTIRFSVGQFAAVDGGTLTVNTLAATMFANYLASVPKLEQLGSMPRRQTPLAIAPHTEDLRLQVRFAGAPGKLKTSLKDVDVDTPEFGAHQHVEVKGNMLIVERGLVMGPARIPAGEYPAFRKRLLEVVQGLSQGVTFER